MNRELYRVIDANFNRSREGLRVCEEVARFVKSSSALTRELKSVRHSISSVLKRDPKTARMLNAARDSAKDVGKAVYSNTEMSRATFEDIFSANMQRVKESLRVLEEFYKMVDNKSSVKFGNLRFKVYGIEKKAFK
jgi:thiamine-phosphate pyrophosphorylase